MDLKEELIRLRENFHGKLALKRNLDTDQSEISRIANYMSDAAIQSHLESNRWFRIFR